MLHVFVLVWFVFLYLHMKGDFIKPTVFFVYAVGIVYQDRKYYQAAKRIKQIENSSSLS